MRKTRSDHNVTRRATPATAASALDPLLLAIDGRFAADTHYELHSRSLALLQEVAGV